ncbi:MAG: energy-coupled thiamine transporter ThiT [Epulopiscium sp. Nele67-Bin005]|nr:MAG: energy-coupled thiamine transporter ThiT [Epulopiscium sp. Nele67-Bin005]
MIEILGAILCALFAGYYIFVVRKTVFGVKMIVFIALSSAIAFVLSMVKIFSLPHGGSINLIPMLPIIVVSLISGRGAGMTSGLVYALLNLMTSPYILTPVQFLLEYFVSPMIVGNANLFGIKGRKRILAGGFVVLGLQFLLHFLAGAIYFGEYAGEGQSIWLYSFIYNGSTTGITSILTCAVLTVFPLHIFLKNKDLKPPAREKKIETEVQN